METHYGYHQSKDGLLKRLNRIEGQVRGIAKMVNEDRYCIDILTQISAVEAAMDKIALELIREHARHCLTNDQVGSVSRDEKVDELVGAVGRLLSK
jgi:CsoR family transcriptional regulator, copper-sensing transcriptional repressor